MSSRDSSIEFLECGKLWGLLFAVWSLYAFTSQDHTVPLIRIKIYQIIQLASSHFCPSLCLEEIKIVMKFDRFIILHFECSHIFRFVF